MTLKSSEQHNLLSLAHLQRPNQHWQVINDTVMGGLSTSQIDVNNNTIMFSGTVSLENNGGFASIRTSIIPHDETVNHVLLHVKGDGKTYQLRLKTNELPDGQAFTAVFKTLPNKWQTIRIYESDFSLTYRGNTLIEQPTVKFNDIAQLGFMIAKQQQGKFALEIADVVFAQA